MKRTAVSRPQPKAASRSGQRKIQQQDNLDEFLMFDAENESRTIKQENEDGAEDTEEMITVDFEMNGQKVSAKMSSTMVQFLNENEALRQQIIEKLLSTAGNSGEQLIITEGPPTTITNGSQKPKAPASTPTTNAVGSKSVHTNATTAGAAGTVKARNSLSSPAIHQTNHQPRPVVAPPKSQETPVPNSSSIDLTKDTTGAPSISDEPTNTKWDHKMIVALLETYGSVTDKVKDYRAAKNLNIWTLIGSRMRSAGYPVTDDACEKKLRAMKEFYKSQLKSKKVNNPPWEYFYLMKGLMSKEANTTNATDPNPSTAMFELDNLSSQSSSDLSSGGEDLDEDLDSDQTREQPRKKRRISTHETWGVELFRRTYLKVEKRKIKEMRAMRKQQRQQCMLESQRNNILSSIAEILNKRPL